MTNKTHYSRNANGRKHEIESERAIEQQRHKFKIGSMVIYVLEKCLFSFRLLW